MAVRGYVRLSQCASMDRCGGIDVQSEEIKRWASDRNLPAYIYTDNGISGSSSIDKRPGMIKLLAELQPDDIVVVVRRDRLGRDVMIVSLIESEIFRCGAKLISTAGEGTGSDDPASQMMRHMVDVVAEFERNLVRERTKLVMQAKKARGERVGSIPYGKRLCPVDKIHLIEDETQKSVIQSMVNYHHQGYGYKKIAKMLNEAGYRNTKGRPWHYQTVRLIVRKELKAQKSATTGVANSLSQEVKD